jgi:hypothetical protein
VPKPVCHLIPPGEKISVETGRAECRQCSRPIGEDHDQHETEPVTRNCEQRDGDDRERSVEPPASRRLNGSDDDADEVAQNQRQSNQADSCGPCGGDHAADRPPRGYAATPVSPDEAAQPCRVLLGKWPVETHRLSLRRQLLLGCGGPDQQ